MHSTHSYFHDGKVDLIWPIQYPSNPPPATPTPLAAYHALMREGCSARV